MLKIYDNARNYDLVSIGSTAAVQQEDGGVWTHGTIVGICNHCQKSRSYTIQITTTGCIVAMNSKHIKITPIAAENMSGINLFDIQMTSR